MTKILVTGDSGFLGSILKRCFIDQNLSIDIVSDKGNRIDISSPFELTDKPFDIVLHAAGKAHSIPNSSEEEKKFYDVNYEGTKNLCQAIENLSLKPKSFIFISTVSVYGVDKGRLINEEHPLDGKTPYAKSKILAEEFLIEWASKNEIILGILRLPLIAGANPPGNLGAMINGIKTRRYLSIGSANARKSIVWAADIASIVHALATHGGVYNLTDGYHPSFGELERCISGTLGKRSVLRIPLFLARVIAKVGDLFGSKAPINTNKLGKITSTLTFDDRKARQKLGWNPNKVLDKIPEIV